MQCAQWLEELEARGGLGGYCGVACGVKYNLQHGESDCRQSPMVNGFGGVVVGSWCMVECVLIHGMKSGNDGAKRANQPLGSRQPSAYLTTAAVAVSETFSVSHHGVSILIRWYGGIIMNGLGS